MSLAYVFDLAKIYKTYFDNSPYRIDEQYVEDTRKQSVLGRKYFGVDAMGREIFLPVTLKTATASITFNCATMRVTGKKTIIKTAVSERKGTVKEEYATDDYQFTIKGVLIGEIGNFPDTELQTLIGIYEGTEPVELENAVSDFFLDISTRVVIESIEFPEVQGKGMRHKPFVIVCESDYIDSLKLE